MKNVNKQLMNFVNKNQLVFFCMRVVVFYTRRQFTVVHFWTLP